MLRPAAHAGLEEEAVQDQLAAPLEQVEQARGAVRALEPVVLVDRHPRHPPALGERVAGTRQLLLLHQQLLAGGLHSCGETIGGMFMTALLRILIDWVVSWQ